MGGLLGCWLFCGRGRLQAGLQQLREELNDLKFITTSWFNPSQTHARVGLTR